MSAVTRRPSAQAWTWHHEACLDLLQHSPKSTASDRLLCQLVLAERVCDRIATELALSDLGTALDVNDLAPKMHSLQDDILQFSAQIPTDLRVPKVTIWQHVMTMYLHEPVLHTVTNKPSFAAPFLAERLSHSDFPAPAVTPAHIASLFALRDAAHALLDTFCSLGAPEVMLALPTILYSARALYAMYILTKLYVAVTAVGNSYGSVFSAGDLKVDEYLRKLMNLVDRLETVDGNAVCIAIALCNVGSL